jgi:hypothetical protein
MTIMCHIRGQTMMPSQLFAGILTLSEIQSLESKKHPPLFALYQIRRHLRSMLFDNNNMFDGIGGAATTTTGNDGNGDNANDDDDVDDDPGGTRSISRCRRRHHRNRSYCCCDHLEFVERFQMKNNLFNNFENQLNEMIMLSGGMERIRSTPLPMVYVSHLRTFLLVTLLSFPYIFGSNLGWGTIPVVAVISVALLGIEAAAVEVENPFQLRSVNALKMDQYCRMLLDVICQLVQDSIDDTPTTREAASFLSFTDASVK